MTVIRRVDDNWAEGMLGDKIGIFPILYVEVSSCQVEVWASVHILHLFLHPQGKDNLGNPCMRRTKYTTITEFFGALP